MKNRSKLVWRVGVALIGLAATALLAGSPTTLAQGPHTEVIGMPAGAIGAPGGGSYQVRGVNSGPSLNAIQVDDGRAGRSTAGGYAVPAGPACTVGVVGGGPGFGQVSDAACGIGGGFVQTVEGGMIEAHYP